MYTVRFGEVSGLSSFKSFKNWGTGCGEIAYCLVGYFILSHPVYRDGLRFQRVTHPSSHRAWCRATWLIETNTTTPSPMPCVVYVCGRCVMVGGICQRADRRVSVLRDPVQGAASRRHRHHQAIDDGSSAAPAHTDAGQSSDHCGHVHRHLQRCRSTNTRTDLRASSVHGETSTEQSTSRIYTSLFLRTFRSFFNQKRCHHALCRHVCGRPSNYATRPLHCASCAVGEAAGVQAGHLPQPVHEVCAIFREVFNVRWTF